MGGSCVRKGAVRGAVHSRIHLPTTPLPSSPIEVCTIAAKRKTPAPPQNPFLPRIMPTRTNSTRTTATKVSRPSASSVSKQITAKRATKKKRHAYDDDDDDDDAEHDNIASMDIDNEYRQSDGDSVGGGGDDYDDDDEEDDDDDDMDAYHSRARMSEGDSSYGSDADVRDNDHGGDDDDDEDDLHDDEEDEESDDDDAEEDEVDITGAYDAYEMDDSVVCDNEEDDVSVAYSTVSGGDKSSSISKGRKHRKNPSSSSSSAKIATHGRSHRKTALEMMIAARIKRASQQAISRQQSSSCHAGWNPAAIFGEMNQRRGNRNSDHATMDAELRRFTGVGTNPG